MLSFILTGAVGRIVACDDGVLIAVTSQRLLSSGEVSLEWVKCLARAQALRAQIERQLRIGDVVRLEGEIEPRRREIKGVAFYDVVFVARWFETLEALPELTGDDVDTTRDRARS